jgi:hypothetical protein
MIGKNDQLKLAEAGFHILKKDKINNYILFFKKDGNWSVYSKLENKKEMNEVFDKLHEKPTVICDIKETGEE